MTESKFVAIVEIYLFFVNEGQLQIKLFCNLSLHFDAIQKELSLKKKKESKAQYLDKQSKNPTFGKHQCRY